MTAIELVGIVKSYDAHQALRDVSLAIEPGEFLAVVGPSGCGKSTLLRIIAGLESQDAGEVRIDGTSIDDVAPKARDVAMVFQSYALYPHMTARQNIALPLVMRELTRAGRLPGSGLLSRRVRDKRAAIRQRVWHAAAAVGLVDCLDRKPGQLSGGQRQRVALARAIVRRPRLFLMDEPLSNLDAKLRAETRGEIVALQQRLGITTLYVTHDQIEAMTMATRIAVMFDGKVVQVGTPREVYEAPATLEVATLIGTPRINVFPIEILGDGNLRVAGALIPFPRIGAQQPPLHAASRPEHVVLTPAGDGPVNGSIRQVEFLGSEGLIHVDITQAESSGPASSIVVKTDAARLGSLGKGSTVSVHFSPAHLHFFDAKGMRIDLAVEAQRPTIESVRRRSAQATAGVRP